MEPSKREKYVYWALTAPVVLAMIWSAWAMWTGAAANGDGLTHLGYPGYVAKILGPFLFLGVFAILYGKSPTLKEWAYAGFTFALLGASASHALAGDGPGKTLPPLALAALVVVSCWQWKNVSPPVR